jgi:hypothetical protein
MPVVVFHGSEAEGVAMLGVLNRYCTCVYEEDVRTSCCAAHAAFAHEQRFSDGLVFERRRLATQFPGAGLRVIRPTEAA